jgi:SulP family sulfate permease
VLFLYRTMSPRVTLRFVPQDPSGGAAAGTVVVRFDGRLYFANVARFEEAVLEATATHPQATRVLVLGSGINEIDASGEDLLRQLHRRLAQNGVQIVFADLNAQVVGVLRATGLAADLGDAVFFASEAQALAAAGAGPG